MRLSANGVLMASVSVSELGSAAASYGFGATWIWMDSPAPRDPPAVSIENGDDAPFSSVAVHVPDVSATFVMTTSRALLPLVPHSAEKAIAPPSTSSAP